MSAFVVPQDHIAALVNAAERHARHYRGNFRWVHNGTHYELTPWGNDEEWTDYQTWGDTTIETHRHTMTLQTLGQRLWDACLASVWARYPDTEALADLPGYIPDLENDGATYRHRSVHVSPVATLKAIACYEYQSCEIETWEKSNAKAFCDALRDAMIYDLPGYDEAPWEILATDEQTQAVAI